MSAEFEGSPMKPKFANVDQTLLAFPTPIRRYVYKDVEEFNRELATRILAMRESSPGVKYSNMGGWHSDRNLLHNLGQELGNRLAGIFVENIRATMLSVVEMDAPLPQELGIEAWANVNLKGHSNAPHIHGGSPWSGVYFVATDPSPSAGGDLFFTDPRTSALMVTHPYNVFKCASRIALRPEPGQIVIFPSFVYHGVDTYSGDSPRISIAFNLA
jgi:uncharacterized protein (TIGR02466 family)